MNEYLTCSKCSSRFEPYCLVTVCLDEAARDTAVCAGCALTETYERALGFRSRPGVQAPSGFPRGHREA